MLIDLENYLTIETIYFYSNFVVLPFWIMLVFIPAFRITKILVYSIILPLILGSLYAYIIYQGFLLNNSFLEVFEIYLGIESLYTVFSNDIFLTFFWIHFLSLNLFLGTWTANDGVKYDIPKKLVFFPLFIIYFTGPVGLVLYWLIRIFYAKKIGLHD